ncbi:expressed unknown protein [Seminavis robusta]|uniref:Uncharacterized protein n=1 Tax=Seminavis robusta TaxID=568900 RepID=A0A9N8DX74_9STRA|nr:expressed unknown protein [Seminavis robusta]|eukprot:Sro412_g137990.1 n/a (263) ;mRNA; r:63735-64523
MANLVDGMMQLLMYAYWSDQSNLQFAFVSDNSIPIKTLDYLHNTLIIQQAKLKGQQPPTSRFCTVPPQKANRTWSFLKPYWTTQHPIKAELWSVLHRSHVQLLLQNLDTLRKWLHQLQGQSQRGAPDEILIPSFLNNQLGPSSLEQCHSVQNNTSSSWRTCCPHYVLWRDQKTPEPPVLHAPQFAKNPCQKGSPCLYQELHSHRLDEIIQEPNFFFLRKVAPTVQLVQTTSEERGKPRQQYDNRTFASQLVDRLNSGSWDAS